MSELFTKGGVLIATGWTRVVNNNHPKHKGSFVEFTHLQCSDNMDLKRRGIGYYDKWYTPDGVLIFQQRWLVEYASYIPGRFYVDVKDLRDGWQQEC